MSIIKFEVNKNNIKSNEKIRNDPCLNKLVQMFVKKPKTLKMLRFTRDLLYEKNIDKINNLLIYGKRLYPIPEFNIIVECFNNWEENIIQNKFSNYMGIFVELLVKYYLDEKFPDIKLHHETRILVNDFKSYTLDYILETDILSFFECKTSSYSLKIKDIDNLIAIMHNLDYSKIYLIIFDNENRIHRRIDDLKENLSNDISYLDKFNIVSFEDFKNGNPF